MISELKDQGLSDKEIIKILVEQLSIPEPAAQMMIAIELYDYPGDAINIDEHPEYA